MDLTGQQHRGGVSGELVSRMVRNPDSSIVAILPPAACDQPTLFQLYRVARTYNVRLGIQFEDTPAAEATSARDHLYVNAVESEIGIIGDLGPFDRVDEVLTRRAWSSLTLSGHSDGAHLNLGDVYVCGLTGDAEIRTDGAAISGCTRSHCKKARPHRPSVHWTGLSANVLALLGCTTMTAGTRLFPSNLSLVLSALRRGHFANIVAMQGAFPALQRIEHDFIRRLRAGERLGDIVNSLNARRELQVYGSNAVLVGDPDFRMVPAGRPADDRDARLVTARRGPGEVSLRSPESMPLPVPGPAGGKAGDPVGPLAGFRAIRDFAVRALNIGDEAVSLTDDEMAEVTAAVEDLGRHIDAYPGSGPDGIRVLLRDIRTIKIDSIYFGLALRPRAARPVMALERCDYCGSLVMAWADAALGYSELWCVTCGHLSAGTRMPGLSCRVRRPGDGVLAVELRSSRPLGSLSLLVRDECRSEVIAGTDLFASGHEAATELEIGFPPSEDTVTVHVLRHSGGVHSYRSHLAGLGGYPAKAADLHWRDGA